MSRKNFSMIDFGSLQEKASALVAAQSDFAKLSFEAQKNYVEKLFAVKAPDQALQLTTDYVKTSYEMFVSEANKAKTLYTDLITTAFAPKSL